MPKVGVQRQLTLLDTSLFGYVRPARHARVVCLVCARVRTLAALWMYGWRALFGMCQPYACVVFSVSTSSAHAVAQQRALQSQRPPPRAWPWPQVARLPRSWPSLGLGCEIPTCRTRSLRVGSRQARRSRQVRMLGRRPRRRLICSRRRTGQRNRCAGEVLAGPGQQAPRRSPGWPRVLTSCAAPPELRGQRPA